MMNILFTCDSSIASTMLFVKNVLNIIMIATPILAIIYISINFAKLVRNPDEKKELGKIKNRLLALAIVFFIPMFVNILFYMMGESNDVSDCWNKVSNVPRSTTYMPIGEDKEKNPVYTDPNDYQKGKPKPKETKNETDTGTSDMPDTPITSCGNLQYCNKFLTSLYNNSKRLNDAIVKNNAKVDYDYGKSVKTWEEAIKIAERVGLVTTTCVVPANWGITDVIGNHKVIYSVDKGGFHGYSGEITKYTKQYKFDGSMSVKTAIQKGVIQPGDIIGVKLHTFAINSVNQKTGSAVVFDGGHTFTNGCKDYKCSTMLTYSAKRNASMRLYQIIRWVK